MDPNLQQVNQKIQDSLLHLQRDLSTIRAGRANPSLLEDISVEAYGGKMKLVELGTITAPQPSLLTIQVWDPSIIKDIEKAIMSANLGLNASVDGQTVRVPIPALTEERRAEFAKLAHQKGEEGRVTIRQIRNDQRDEWKNQKESGDISEDEFFRREKFLQEVVDKANEEIDSQVKQKQEELRQI
jgi:ribosome recycling factor